MKWLAIFLLFLITGCSVLNTQSADRVARQIAIERLELVLEDQEASERKKAIARALLAELRREEADEDGNDE